MTVVRSGGGYEVGWQLDGDQGLDVDVLWSTSNDDPEPAALTSVSGESSVVVDDPAPGERIFFTVAAGDSSVMAATRGIELEQVFNFRDLGGYETTDGRTVAWGELYRGGELGEATEEDLALMLDLDIRLVCDLRSDPEVEELPDPDLGGENLRLPIADGADVVRITNAVLQGDLSVLGPELLIEGTAVMPIDFVDQYAAIFSRIIDEESRPTNIHCTGGKDRAGVATALILRVLGVPEETVMEDYLLSNVFRAEENQHAEDQVRPIVAAANGIDPADVDLEPLTAVLEVRPEYLQAAWDAIDAEYGSFDNYVREGLGLSEDDVESLRDQLLV